MSNTLRRSGIVVIAAAAILSVGAYTWPDTPPSGPAGASTDCQFAIRATNSLSIDVWVNLYDSYVKLDGVGILGRNTQLKIQNHRLAPGKSMDRRFTAPGGCARKRDWVFFVRTGGPSKIVRRHTEGTSSTSRTVDLGRSSRW